MASRKSSSTTPSSLTWDELRDRCENHEGLSPSERETLVKDLELFIANYSSIDNIEAARDCLSRLQNVRRHNLLEQHIWSLERIEKVILSKEPRPIDFELAINQLFNISARINSNDLLVTLMHLARRVLDDNEIYLNILLKKINSLRPPTEKIRLSELFKQNFFVIADENYLGAEFGLAIKAYSIILMIDPEDTQALINREKAEKFQREEKRLLEKNIPLQVIKPYFRYVSSINAQDFESAKLYLEEAISIAADMGIEFDEARETLENLIISIRAKDLQPNILPPDIQGLVRRVELLIETEDINLERIFNELQSKLHNRNIQYPQLSELGDKVVRVVVIAKLRNDWHIAIINKDWSKVKALLQKAVNLGLNEISPIVNSLRSLLRAKELISRLRRNQSLGRRKKIKEIESILDSTAEVTELIGLWEEINESLSKHLQEQKSIRHLISGLLFGLVIVFGASALFLWRVYLFPNNTETLNCMGPFNGIGINVNYPYYFSNGDIAKIKLTVWNNTATPVSGIIQVAFRNPQKIHLIKGSKNLIELNDLKSPALIPGELEFQFNDEYSTITKPHPIEFTIQASDSSQIYDCKTRFTEFNGYIASAPIPYLQSVFKWQIGLMSTSGILGILLSGLMMVILDYLKSIFISGKPQDPNKTETNIK